MFEQRYGYGYNKPSGLDQEISRLLGLSEGNLRREDFLGVRRVINHAFHYGPLIASAKALQDSIIKCDPARKQTLMVDECLRLKDSGQFFLAAAKAVNLLTLGVKVPLTLIVDCMIGDLSVSSITAHLLLDGVGRWSLLNTRRAMVVKLSEDVTHLIGLYNQKPTESCREKIYGLLNRIGLAGGFSESLKIIRKNNLNFEDSGFQELVFLLELRDSRSRGDMPAMSQVLREGTPFIFSGIAYAECFAAMAILYDDYAERARAFVDNKSSSSHRVLADVLAERGLEMGDIQPVIVLHGNVGDTTKSLSTLKGLAARSDKIIALLTPESGVVADLGELFVQGVDGAIQIRLPGSVLRGFNGTFINELLPGKVFGIFNEPTPLRKYYRGRSSPDYTSFDCTKDFDDLKQRVGLPMMEPLGCPVVTDELRAEAKALLSNEQLPIGRTIVIAPLANAYNNMFNTNKNLVDFWVRIVQVAADAGLRCVLNLSNRGNVSADVVSALANVKAVDIPIHLAIPFVDAAGAFLGVRSGLCDLLAFSGAKKMCVYPKVAKPQIKDDYGLGSYGFDEFILDEDNEIVQVISWIKSIC